VASVQSGALLATLDLLKDPVTAVASDGQFAVSVNRRGELIGYEYAIALSGVEAGGAGNGAVPVDKRNQYVKGFEGQGEGVLDVALSGDRKLLAVAAAAGTAVAEVRVYRVADRQRVAAVPNVPGPVFGLSLNADGSRLAVGGKTGAVRVYELPGGRLMKSLTPVPVQAVGP
jgi:WD40 repeat protein